MWLAWWIETFITLFYATRKGLPFIWRPYFYIEDLEEKHERICGKSIKNERSDFRRRAKKPAKKKSLSISVKLKKVKSYQKQQEIMCEWAEGWQKDMENTLLQLRRAAMRDDHGEIMHMIDRLTGMCNKRFVGLENAIHIISDSDRDLIDKESNMKKYSKDDFKSMINDFLADHADEYEDDQLKIEEPEQGDEGYWCCIAEDSKARYALFDDGTGNIQIEYIGTK